MVGSGDAKFFPLETVARLKAVDDRVLERGETIIEEMDVSPDNLERTVYLEVKTPIYDDAGKIVGLCGISTDITERKRVEGALKKTPFDLQEAQRVARLGSWIWDVATDAMIWSDELYRLYDKDKNVPPPSYEESLKLFAPESALVVNAAMQNALLTGESYQIDLELAHPGG